MNILLQLKTYSVKNALNLILFLSLSSFNISVFAEPQLTGSPSEIQNFLTPKNNSVFLRAEASQTIKPNQAKITLKISSSNAQLSGAMQNNQNLQTRIIDNLNQEGIDGRYIMVARFASADNTSWVGSPNQYKVANRISITVLNESQMKSVADIIDAFDGVSILTLEFENAAQNEFENEVRARAIEKVLQQKSFFEKKLGLTLRPIQFNHSPSYSAVSQSNQSNQFNTSYSNKLQKYSELDEKVYTSVIEVEFEIN